MEADANGQLTMLQILYGACSAAVDAFRGDDRLVDEQLVTDLEEAVTRTRREIERLTRLLARRPSHTSPVSGYSSRGSCSVTNSAASPRLITT